MALRSSGQPFTRIEFHQKRGDGFAELYEIQPVGKYQSLVPETTATGSISANPIRL